MKISIDTMNRLHRVQLEMLIELIRVMDTLHLKYYFVHGSLLGAVRDHDFIAEDDDIDIALLRNDYDKLFARGNELINPEFFLQNSDNDEFPLAMGKMRKNHTAFIQPILKKCSCNKGIYIDIFPVDFHSDSLCFRAKNKLLRYRISEMMTSNSSIKRKILMAFATAVYPTRKIALHSRERLYAGLHPSEYLSIYNGKPTERKMPATWFAETETCDFCGTEVLIPGSYKEYLERIYGKDFLNHNPAKDRIDDHGEVEISADILDFDKSYREYEKTLPDERRA